MRKAIRDSWNNYMSRRRLDNLWTQFIASQTDNSVPNAQTDEILANFQQCLLDMVNESKKQAKEKTAQQKLSAQPDPQQNLQTSPLNKKKSGKKRKSNHKPLAPSELTKKLETKAALPAEENLDFFVQKDEYLPAVCTYLQNDRRSGEDWAEWQITQRNLVTTLRCIQVFLKDVQHSDKQPEQQDPEAAAKAYLNVMSMIKFQLSHANQVNSIKQLIKLLHLIFVYQEEQMVCYAEQEGFLTILHLLKLENEPVTETVLKYFAKWFQVDEQYNQEDSDDPERIISTSDFANRPQGYLQGMLGKMRDSFHMSDISMNDLLNKDFVQEEGLNEESKDDLQEGNGDASRMLTRQRSSERKDSNASETAKNFPNSKGIQSTPDSQVRKLLRQGQFLLDITETIKVCHESRLIHYAHILKTINVFASVNFQQAKKAGVFQAIQDRFRKGETQFIEVFDLFMLILEIQGKAKVKNQHFWELNMKIIETMFEGQKDGSPAHEELLVHCIKKLKAVTYQQNPKVSSVLLQESSQQRIRRLIIQVAYQQNMEILVNLLDFLMLLLHNMRNENKSHVFAIQISELLLKQRGKRTIGAQQGKQLFQFLRLIIKDKKSMISDLMTLDQEDQMLDLEHRIDQILDNQMKKFLKLTFPLYFDFNKDNDWHMESQMLLLCGLDLQEKVNQVGKVHSIPQMLSLFKESEEDSEIEGINFLETIQALLNQREESQFQDIFNGFLAAKMTIVLQDTPLLSMEDIKTLVNDLIQEKEQDPLDTLNQSDRSNPFIATIFSSNMNCRATELQDYLAVQEDQILRQICQNLTEAVQRTNQKQIVKNLHRLVLMSQNSKKYKQAIEQIFDFKVILNNLEIRLFDVEAQLFILQCLLEMQADKVIYEGSIMSFEAILMHQNYQSGEQAEFELFRKVLHEVNKEETLRDHDFMGVYNNHAKQHMLEIQEQVSGSLENPFSGSKQQTSSAALNSAFSYNKTIGGSLRQNSLGFTLFLLTLAQANHEVQFQVLEDLCMLAEQSLRNVRVMVQQNIQVYLLQLLKFERDSIGVVARLGSAPSRYLVNLLQILLSYGVCVPRHTNNEKDLLVECLGQKRKLNDLFIDSVTECLSTSFSQISGYVHFMDKKVGQTALKIDGGAIGVSSWLLTPEVHPETHASMLVCLNLSHGLKITIDILLDRPRKKYNVLDDQDADGDDNQLLKSPIKDFEGASHTSEQEESDEELDPSKFQLRLSLTSRSSMPDTEVFKLEDMISLSVFHLHGFNHYVTQFGANGGFDLFINGHKLAAALFLDQLGQDRNIILKSLDFAEQMTVANLSLIHSAVGTVSEIEQLRNGDFTVNQNELMGLTQLQSVSQNNYFVNLLQGNAPVESQNESDDNAFTLHLPEQNSLELEHKRVQVVLERHLIEIPVLTDDASSIEVFQDSDSIMTLKRYLSTEYAINAILDLLEATVEDDSTLKCLRLLASILIQNKERSDLVDLDLARLTNLLASKLPDMYHSQTKAVFVQLVEVACDELNCSTRIDEKICQQTGIRQPSLYQSRICFLQIGLDLVESTPVDQSIQFLEMVQTLLKVDENLKVFRKHIGINSIFSLFRLIEQYYKFLSLYDITLALFELFIGGISRGNIGSLSEEEKQEMSMIFEFIQSRDLECRLKFIKVSQQLSSKYDVSIASFQNLLLSSQKQNELVARVTIDCLSIISIHILTEVSELAEKKNSVLLNKIIQSVDLVSFCFSLIHPQQGSTFVSQSGTKKSSSLENPMAEVREYALKFLQLMLFLSEDFTRSFEAKGAFKTLSSFIVKREGQESDGATDSIYKITELEAMEAQITKKVPYLLSCKRPQGYQASKSLYNLNMLMLDAATSRFDNVYAMSPEKQTLVHTVMNRSKIAEQIVAQINSTLKKPKKVKIVYFGMIQTFLTSLAQLENDVSRYICLKHLHQLLIQNEDNLNALLDDAKTLKDIIHAIFQFELEVTRKDGYASADTRKCLLDLIANCSPNEETAVGQQEMQNGVSDRERNHHIGQIKSLNVALEIIKDLLVKDLERPPQLSLTFQLLTEFPETDSVFQFQVITWLLRHYQRNPKITECNVIQNLQKILANHEIFLGEDPHVSMKSIILINTLALKSSNKFREHLKSLKLIELRDKLLIDQTRKTYRHICEMQAAGVEPDEVYINSICSLFSYGQLASKTIFTANYGVEYLTLVNLLVAKMADEVASPVKYAEYSRQLKERIKEEVMQFSQNDTSPELSAYFQVQGDAAFFSRLRNFLSQRVSGHMEAKRSTLKEMLEDTHAKRNTFNQEQCDAEQVQAQILTEVQEILQRDLKQIFEKAKSSIF